MHKLRACLPRCASRPRRAALRAQDRYPSRSIKFVVPFTAGSATDTLARLLGNHVSQSLGQTRDRRKHRRRQRHSGGA